jgi:hypothetical protein
MEGLAAFVTKSLDLLVNECSNYLILLVLRQNQRQLDEMASELQGMGGA